MKTIVIKEYSEIPVSNDLMEVHKELSGKELDKNKFENALKYRLKDSYIFDLSKVKVNHCVGCWSCWWKTPGRCMYKDLDQFYHEYITSDKAIYFAKVTKGFVGGNMKNLFDRMIPLYLPYTTYKTGESMHVKRYEKYPDIEFYYDGEFKTEDERKIYEDFIKRVFYQFYSKVIKIAHVKEFINLGREEQ